MNPLSALRSLASPALRAEPPIQPLAESATPKPIPFTAPEKLSPGIPPNPVDAARPTPDAFEKALGGLVSEVSSRQTAATEAVSGLISGKNVSLHQTMIAMEEASVSFQLMVEVRNKLLESYQELMRMQI